jgi:hypothetical protein
MYNTLQSGQVAKEKDAPCSKVKKFPSHVLYFALVRSLKKSASSLGPRFKQAAANFFVTKVQISTSESGPCTSMYVSTLEIAGNGPK